MNVALEGIKVVELCEIMQGPLAGQTLGDLGADVIKIERGTRGDAMRVLDRYAVEHDRMSSYFTALNRNKRSISVDLKTPGGMGIVHRLLVEADVLVHNYRPEAIQRLGLSYPDLAARYPRLIYAAASGFGDTGPLVHKAGQDMLAQTLSGLARAVGDDRVESYLSPTPAGDFASGTLLVQGVLAALLERARSGRGQQVTVNLFDTSVAMQMLETAARTMYGQELNWVTQWYSGTFATRDGVVTVLGLFRDNAVGLLCQALGVEDISAWSELATTELQARNKDKANVVLAPAVAQLTTEEALAAFDKVDLLSAPQLSLGEALAHPQLAANELLVDVNVARQAPARVVGYPVRLSRTPAVVAREVPERGQHTDEVLTELGFDEAAITSLARDRAIETTRCGTGPMVPAVRVADQ